MAKHAFLSASSSDRWLHCPPSAKLCAQEEDPGSPYAQEGSDAHALCQYELEKALGRESKDPRPDLTFYNEEMQEGSDGYVAFVMEQLAAIKETCPDPAVLVEQTLDFSKWVTHGFGTGDCVIVADDLLQIIDYKYGMGVLVSASGSDGTGNSQLKLYALGALDTFGDLYSIKRIRLSIYQPRRQNIDSFDLTKEELLSWAENTLAPVAKLAFAGDGDFTAGDHCVFCRIRSTCRKRSEYNRELAKYDFAPPPTLTEAEIAEILPRLDQLTSWAEDMKAYALQEAVKGIAFPGFKLVEGRSNRRFTDETAVAKIVTEAGYEAWDRKLQTITNLQKQMGRKIFNELLSSYIEKPRGKPVLVPATDNRPAFNPAEADFKDA
ncbi:MAG: DUF2800 domain-containing protein [Clostridia bacterium]|nr:DUF2800 domain-containing protein [Clostridia bacterium]